MPDDQIHEPRMSPFEQVRQEDERGNEYWSARDLAQVLGYTQWRNFRYAVEKARTACENSGHAVSDHFADSSKMIEAGKGAQREEQRRLERRRQPLLYCGEDQGDSDG